METVELIVGIFKSSGRADEALGALNKLDKQHIVDLHNSAIIFKDSYGHTKIKDQGDVDTKKGALFGAISGALLGLLAGPAGLIIGAATGAATGGITAKKLDLGFSDELLGELKDALKLNHSIVLVSVESEWGDQVAKTIEIYEGLILRHALKSDLVKQIMDAQR